MSNRNRFYPLCLNAKAFTVLIGALTLISGCGGGSTSDSPSQNSLQNDSPGNNAQPAAEALSADSFLLTVSRDEIFRVSPVSGIPEVLYTLPNIGDRFVGPPDVLGNLVLIGDNNNTLHVINLDTGNLDWKQDLNVAEPRVEKATSVVVCADPVCYVAGATGVLLGFNPITREVFVAANLHTNNGGGDVDSLRIRPLLVQGNYIYAATDYGNSASAALQILDRVSGALVKRIALGDVAMGVPVLKDNLILVATQTSINAYSTDSYQLIWQSDFDGSNGLSGTGDMAVAGDIVVVTSDDVGNRYGSDGRVFVGVSVNTGELLWTANAGVETGKFSPQTDGTTIFTAQSHVCAGTFSVGTCKSGFPIALKPETGQVLWDTTKWRYVVKGEPLVAAGSLYFGKLQETHPDTPKRFGFIAIDKATAEINYHAPQVDTLYTTTPILVNNGKVHRADHYPVYKP